MRQLLQRSGIGIGIALAPVTTHAGNLEDLQTFVGNVGLYTLLLIAIVVAVYVYFMKLQDQRTTPLNKVFEGRETIHYVAPDTVVTECVRAMSAKKIGAMIIMDGAHMVGIFTERDALNRVLAAGLDPRSTKVSAVMTRDPYCVAPTTTVGAAMELVTRQRFRHLPVVENGKVLAVVSSGDLTHWLVRNQMAQGQATVDLAASS